MNLNNVELHKTAAQTKQFPKTNMPEIAFIGKSNVGKSSLINFLLNRKSLARVGAKPGKTRVINFYSIDNKLFFVDLPGYGYASVSKSEQEAWGKLIDSYLYNREQLCFLVLLVDIRHKPGENDLLMYNWIKHYKIPFIICATKADKLSRSKMHASLKAIKDTFSSGNEIKIIPCSTTKSIGRETLWEEILGSINYSEDK